MELRRAMKYRNIWLGTAMIMIIFFHCGLGSSRKVIELFRNHLYGGVDICVFASGIGCYYSLEKDPDPLRFLSRRLRRLGPTYLCFLLPWLLWKQWSSPMPATAVLGNILGIQAISPAGHFFNWYIGGLAVYYLLLPYLKQITDRCGHLRQDLLAALLLAAVSIPYWQTSGNGLKILSRLPVLYAGLVFGKLAARGYVLRRKDLLMLGGVALAGFIAMQAVVVLRPQLFRAWGLGWYPLALVVPGVCLLLSRLAELLDACPPLRWINRLTEAAGRYSFELYLVHILLFEILEQVILPRFAQIHATALWIAAIFCVVLGTWLLNRTVQLLNRAAKNSIKKA